MKDDNISLKPLAIAHIRYEPKWFSIQIQIYCDHFFKMVQDCARVMQLTYLYLLNTFVEHSPKITANG